jgi:ABC-type sulfate transport system substrate-binding protein
MLNIVIESIPLNPQLTENSYDISKNVNNLFKNPHSWNRKKDEAGDELMVDRNSHLI